MWRPVPSGACLWLWCGAKEMGKVMLITSVYQWLNKLKAHCRPPAGQGPAAPAFCTRSHLHSSIALCVPILPGWLWFGQDESSQIKIDEIWASSFQQHQLLQPDPFIIRGSHQWNQWAVLICTRGQLDQLSPCPPHPMLKAKMGRNICGIPFKTLVSPGRACGRILYFVVTVGTAREGSAPDRGPCLLGSV